MPGRISIIMTIILKEISLMSKYFNLLELCHSDTADELHIDNTPNDEVRANLDILMELLDKIREKWKSPIYVTSGYRCPQLNKKVGGAAHSQHILGQAADIKAKNKKNRELFYLIKSMVQSGEIEVGQLIWEYGTDKAPKWIHVSTPDGKHHNQILYIGVKHE